MPLNYSKWDKLEVSDDSDIEGHPNVDHRSLVAWKRRDIHEKRAVRNAKITQLKADIACNEVLLPRLRTITEEVHGAIDGPAHFSSIVERLKTNPGPEAPPPLDFSSAAAAKKIITYDEMILALLMKVYHEAEEKGLTKPGGGNEQRLQETLVASLKQHGVKLGEENEKLKKELAAEEAEKAKKITSEDIHEGFESHYAPPKPEPKPVKPLKGDKKTQTEKRTDIEVLNPKAVDQAHAATLASQTTPSGPPPAGGKPSATTTATTATADTADTNDNDNAYDDDDELPEMTPSLVEFSKIPLKAYEQSFQFIQEHRDVYVPGASDALLIAAFTSEREGNHKYAKQCVHQSLLIQYCEKLGPDGVRLFFKKMMAGDPRAESVFVKDVEDTYNHVKSRVEATRKEMEARGGDGEGEEQIQLVPESDGGQISFVIPDGPPPAHLTLEGPGTEGLDIEEVRKALEMRWDVFDGFREDLKEALRSQSLDNVNKVLAKMDVREAESVVGLLDTAGILNFADGGIRDETGREPAQNGGANLAAAGEEYGEMEDVEDVPGSGDEADEESDDVDLDDHDDDEEGDLKKETIKA